MTVLQEEQVVGERSDPEGGGVEVLGCRKKNQAKIALEMLQRSSYGGTLT